MPKFKVKEGQTVEHDGNMYAAGATVELTQKQADAMPWALEAVADAKKPDPASSK